MPRHHDCSGMKRRRSLKSTTSSHHCAARLRSASPSQTTSVVQHASPHASGSEVSPPSAIAIASSSSATPSSTRPCRTSARPSWASAMHSTSASATACRHRQGVAAVPLRLDRVLGALRVLDREPAQLGHRAGAGEQPPRTREPARGRRVLPVDPVLGGEVRGEPARAAIVAAAPVGRVGLAPAVDPRVALAEPPERLAEPVERLRVAGVVLEHRRERVARGRPVGGGEVLPAGLVAAHPVSARARRAGRGRRRRRARSPARAAPRCRARASPSARGRASRARRSSRRRAR